MSRTSGSLNRNHPKSYDYLLKFLLVGDSDVGKQEILSGLEDGSQESPFCGSSGKYKYFMYFFYKLHCFMSTKLG